MGCRVLTGNENRGQVLDIEYPNRVQPCTSQARGPTVSRQPDRIIRCHRHPAGARPDRVTRSNGGNIGRRMVPVSHAECAGGRTKFRAAVDGFPHRTEELAHADPRPPPTPHRSEPEAGAREKLRAAYRRSSLFPKCRLRRRQAGNRHAERRATHIVQPDPVAELHAVRLAAVLTADADL